MNKGKWVTEKQWSDEQLAIFINNSLLFIPIMKYIVMCIHLNLLWSFNCVSQALNKCELRFTILLGGHRETVTCYCLGWNSRWLPEYRNHLQDQCEDSLSEFCWASFNLFSTCLQRSWDCECATVLWGWCHLVVDLVAGQTQYRESHFQAIHL